MNAGDDEPGSGHPALAASLSVEGEEGIIRVIKKKAAAPNPRLIKGIGDDAAVMALGEKTAFSTDLLVENVHFRLSRTLPFLLGRKALSVNLSDLAAMGARPEACLLGLGCPPETPGELLDQFLEGFAQKAREAQVSLVGGDVCRSDLLVIAVTVWGSVSLPAPVYRSGAHSGDLIFVTGTVGDSALGLMALEELEEELNEELLKTHPLREAIIKHLDPEPRLAAGLALAGVAKSMIDLSDGIIPDLLRLLQESGGPGAVIHAQRLPLSPVFRSRFQVEKEGLAKEALQAALAGGEDYELLFTASPEQSSRIKKLASRLGVPITWIGEVRPEAGIVIVDEQGRELPAPPALFLHF